MTRRKPYTKVKKRGQQRPDHVQGMGDVLFRGFQCLSSECQEFIVVREDDVDADFQIACPTCAFIHQAGGETKFFDYVLVHRADGEVIEEGEFAILHDDYIGQAQRLKYCLLCYTASPSITSTGIDLDNQEDKASAGCARPSTTTSRTNLESPISTGKTPHDGDCTDCLRKRQAR